MPYWMHCSACNVDLPRPKDYKEHIEEAHDGQPIAVIWIEVDEDE